MNNLVDFSNVLPSNVYSLHPYNILQNVFDENSIDFKLTGGPLHSEVLIASATMKKGPNEGMPLPLYCTWYIVSKDNNEFVVIEHVSGACYQPSIDDIGYRICVHAIPASDAEEYQGMPMFAEVGPLLMDVSIEQRVNEAITNSDMMTFQVQLEKVQDQSLLLESNLKFPMKCSLILQRDKVNFYQTKAIITIDHLNSYNFIIIKHANNKVEVKDGNDQTLVVFTMKNNIERDIFIMVYRSFKSNAEEYKIQQEQKVIKEEEEKEIIDPVQQIEAVSVKEVVNEADMNSQLESNEREREHNYARKIEELNQAQDEVKKYESEVNFFKQEVNMVQNENQKLKKKLNKMKSKLEVMTTSNTPSEYSSIKDEPLCAPKDISIQTNEEDLEEGHMLLSMKEAVQKLKDLESERDKINGERNYFKKNLDSMKLDYDKLLKKVQLLEQPSINESASISMVAQTSSQILCGGCGAEILDKSFKSDQFPYQNTHKIHQLEISNKRAPIENNTQNIILQQSEPKRAQFKKKNIKSVYGHFESKEGIEEKVQEVINLSQNNNHLNKSISLEGDQEIQQNTSEGLDQNIFEDEDTQLVNDFVKKMSLTMAYPPQQQQPVFPEERLMLLIEENSQMKQDLEAKLDKIKQYQYLVDEHKRALDDEIKKCNQYKQLLGQQKGFSLSIGGNNKQLDQMNKLINTLTVMIGEKDEELSIQKNINRELSRKVNQLDNEN